MRRAISLAEILVVTAIVAILAAISTSVIAGTKSRAKAAACVSNQRQFALALSLYLPDYDEQMPLTETGRGVLDPLWWPRQVEPYLGVRATAIQCPTYRPYPFLSASTRAHATGYALNGCMLGATRVPSPATTVLLAEAADIKYGRRTTEPGPNLYLWTPDSYWRAGCQSFGGLEPCEIVLPLGSRRHSRQGHYTFVDGHVKALPPEVFRVYSRPERETEPCTSDASKLTGAPGDPSFQLVD